MFDSRIQVEQVRLDALRNLNILDTPPSESFDRITRTAGRIFDLPIAAVSLTDADRQWFKSRIGVDHWQIPRENAPCSEVSEFAGTVVIKDFQDSACYRDSHLGRSGIRFYAGAPLVTRDGHALGALCVLGTEPRDATPEEISALEDLAAMVMAQIELQHAFGRIDPVSGLPNRNQLLDDLEDLARDKADKACCVTVIDLISAVDLANLLRVAGPSFLDDLIASSSRSVRQTLGRTSGLYHIAATQYAYASTGQDLEELFAETLQVRAGLLADSRLAGETFSITPAIGLAPFVLGKAAPRDVLRMAHSAAQDARDADTGAGIYSLALDEAHRRRFALIGRMREALVRPGELWLAYQPRIDLRSGHCVGAEALLRWNHPVLGAVSPGEFMPLIEQTRLARDVTEWVIRSVLMQAAEWISLGRNLVLSLNISASNLAEEDFAERLIAAVTSAGLPPSAIEIELTESAIIEKGELPIEHLKRINDAGLGIAIDDFGTGYSSLSYLEHIPAKVLKIDRSFMKTLGSDPRSSTLVGAMISLSHDLGYRVVGEGVETEEVYRLLQQLGCDEAQGFLMCRPLPAADMISWLEERSLPPLPLRRLADLSNDLHWN
ncbi:GGDEF and EAL domain-containing protein [Terrihabitans rhizophilus]|uniref:GGDEF and EAL domain-containing protein n=1 Tax=Terrihabitans rhizophilus TaxID=3092662 RepID=A0ABU4RJ97_9HYPH|nr:GGDEF and EAL domain-containing protein [Terrihabitans sp. PJ23]MDX6804906.1 GGDEF and EAL domain-containing protein [Terrihabitans sp. PJ23]